MISKIKRIAISSGYGGFSVPDVLKDEYEKRQEASARNPRLILAEMLEEFKENCTESYPDAITAMNAIGSDYIRCGNDFYFRSSELGCIELSIIEVDSSRPWTMKCYDGLESIAYLDDFILIDDELNLYDCINLKYYD